MIDLNRNVGTNGNAVSALHEYAVGLIYDRVFRRPDERSGGESDVRLPMINGEMSGNVLDGVKRVAIPTVLTPIGGFVPDIALYGEDENPLRVIEVVCTSQPSEKKRDFFDHYGIEMVEVPCRTEEDLHALARPTPRRRRGEPRKIHDSPSICGPWTPWPYRRDIPGRDPQRTPFSAQQKADSRILGILDDLAMASPHVRREFIRVVHEELETLESLLPLQADNPKRDLLFDTPKE